MTIISNIPGRIRLRDERLTDAVYTEQIRSRLLALPEVTGAEVNQRTASLLVTYSPTPVVEEHLRNALHLPEPLKPAQKPATGSRTRPGKSGKKTACLPFTQRQILNYGMMITFAASGIGIALHYKKLHALAGFLFFGISSLHMYDKRKTLFV